MVWKTPLRQNDKNALKIKRELDMVKKIGDPRYLANYYYNQQ